MTVAEIRAALARLETAGKRLRERSAAERLVAVGRVLDAWSDPTSAVRCRLLEQHPAASGLSRPTVAAGLELGLAGWDAAALERLVARELGPPGIRDTLRLEGVSAVVHGGVIPMPSLVDALAPLVLASPVLAKPALRDPVTPRLVAESLAALAPELAGCLELADVRRGDEAALAALLGTARVLVTGSDEAVAAIRRRLAPGSRLLAHGHKLSVAVLGAEPGTDLAEAAERLAVDVALWDQLGCLSPVACFVLGGRARTEAFASALAGALAGRERAWPRGELAAAEAARVASERAEAELRAAAGAGVALHAGPGLAFTVVAEPDAALRPAPLHRFVRVHPVPDPGALADALAPLAPHLAGVALQAAGREAETLRGLARRLGATRIEPFGRLQAAPLDWARDGLGPLAALMDG